MTTPFVLTFNLRRSVFEQLGLSLFNHISQLQLNSGKVLLLPIVNGLADSVHARAEAIRRQLPQLLHSNRVEKCHLISYSLSGIDARYAISNLGISTYAKSLTTLSTPHRGCRLAWLSERQVISDKQAEPIARLLGVGLRPFWEATPENMLYFNDRVKNASSVRVKLR
jgi:triacylglycerol esterase/lipase EstA (alpha/beta hydrolase family)